jgi:cystathionine beta-lyase/cystathionine gamma-synthase
MNRSPRFDTLAIHAGQPHDAATGAVTPPIHLSTTFAQVSPGSPGPFEYSRTGNPTRQMLERCVAALEGAVQGVAFASGSAAAAAVMHTLAPGDHVVACYDVYGGTYRLLTKIFEPMGVAVTWVDMTDLVQVAAAITSSTKLLWVETPTNPLLKLVDIHALSALGRARQVRTVVDNTFATPVLQQPLALGADVVVHSTTKYLNGHADVVGGLILTNDDAFATRLRFIQNSVGAVPSPFDCYLVLRGLKTLPLRMRRHAESAAQLATFLEAHASVERVLYPGLASHAQHALAQRQMRLPGGMISFVARDGLAGARRVLESLRIFACAESLGGVESLAEHPASMTHAAVPAHTRASLGIVDGLVRLSVGLEDVADLQDDLAQALNS